MVVIFICPHLICSNVYQREMFLVLDQERDVEIKIVCSELKLPSFRDLNSSRHAEPTCTAVGDNRLL